MKCLTPVYLDRGTVSCGRCYYCLQRIRAEWTIRLKHEFDLSSSGYFLTLTYADENLRYVNEETGEVTARPTLVKSDLQKFMKLLRHGEGKLRYYAVGEYGDETSRPHYHMILFNLSQSGVIRLTSTWSLGGVDVKVVNDANLHYVSKYHMNKHSVARLEDGRLPSFCYYEPSPWYWGWLPSLAGEQAEMVRYYDREGWLHVQNAAVLFGSDLYRSDRSADLDREQIKGYSEI